MECIDDGIRIVVKTLGTVTKNLEKRLGQLDIVGRMKDDSYC